MSSNSSLSPAAIAAEQSLRLLYTAIEEGGNFIFEAGAGAGKTFSLVKALQKVIDQKGKIFLKAHQRIGCISFTNVAKEQIDIRTDKHPVVHSDTIHAFCWSLIRQFQQELRVLIPQLGEKWKERIENYHNGQISNEGVEQNGTEQLIDYLTVLKGKEIIYQLGYPSIEDNSIHLYHDDVLHLTIQLLQKSKFRQLLASKYPVIFIDEYQDTYTALADALLEHFINTNTGPQIGFFGDHWQKIYGHGCGEIKNNNLLFIPKNANFRSVPAIVNVLNEMRPDLKQEVEAPEAQGTAKVFHTNMWNGERRKGAQWKGDLPVEYARRYLSYVWNLLENEGWNFTPDKTKVLILTHNVLANQQGYENLAGVFDNNEAYVKKEDKYLAYFMDVLEPICEAFSAKKYGEMFSIIGSGRQGINSHSTKNLWNNTMADLVKIREEGTIGDVLDYLHEHRRPQLPENIELSEKAFKNFVRIDNEEEPNHITKNRSLRNVKYAEVIAVTKFVNDHTPFATKHSVKGEQFENVLVVIGRGWNQYNFDQMLGWFGNVPADKQETYERSRNLFYVTCSRPQKNLAVLFTQELSDTALSTLRNWFGLKNIIPLPSKLS